MFNDDNTLKSTAAGGGGGGGGGGVIGRATGIVCDVTVATGLTGLTKLECFLEDSADPEDILCDEECPCP